MCRTQLVLLLTALRTAGTIREHRTDEEDGFLFKVMYSDGDVEELDVKEMLGLVITDPTRKRLKSLIVVQSPSPQPFVQDKQPKKKDESLQLKKKFDPNDMIGLKFKKKFGDYGVFTGKITSHRMDQEEGLLFKAIYPDGDEEELNPSELFLLFPFESSARRDLESVLLPPVDRYTLPHGWTISLRKRKDGRQDSYFHSPSGDILRSMPDVNRYLGRKTKSGSVHRRPRIHKFEQDETKSKKKKKVLVFKDDDYDILRRAYIADLDTETWVPCVVYSRKGSTFQSDDRRPVVLYLPNSDEYEGLSRPYVMSLISKRISLSEVL